MISRRISLVACVVFVIPRVLQGRVEQLGRDGQLRASRMPLLKALQARLRDGEGPDDGSDGYYVRTKENEKLGPMTGQLPPHEQNVRPFRPS